MVTGFVFWVSLFGTVPSAAEDPLDAARTLHLAGKWREAINAYAEVTVRGNQADAATAFNNMCVIYTRLANYPAALESCRAGLQLRRGLNDPWRLGRTLNNIGLALQRLGRYGDAELSYREALEINQRLGDVEAQLINRQNLGLTLTEAGRYGEALMLFHEGEELAAEHSNESWAIYQGRLARLNRGVVLEKLGAYREALKLYQQLAEEREHLDDSHWASLQVNLGVMYRNLGDPVRAVAAFEEAATAYQRLGDDAALSNATLNLALAWHLNLDRLGDAEDAYRKALELARASGDRAEEIQDLFYLGRLLLKLGRLDEAKVAFDECLEAAEAAGSAEGRWSAVYGLGRLDAERGQRRQALERFERAIGEIETVRAGLAGGEHRAGYFGDKRPVYAAAIDVLAALEAQEPGDGHGERALEIVQRTKARELLESLGDRGSKAQPRVVPRTAGELASLVGDDLLVEYFISQGGLYRWVVHGGTIRLDDLGPAQPILARVLEVHGSLAAGQSPSAAVLQTLSQELLSGLETELADAARVWIAPDGVLHYLPFEILTAGSGQQLPLIEVVEVAYLPSASTLAALMRDREPAVQALAGFGNPELRNPDSSSLSGRFAHRFGLQPLPAAARELATVSELLGGENEIVSGAQATEAAFRQAAERGARIVHLATHTVVDERPGQGAAILLTPEGHDDGLLRPAEIGALDLRFDLTVLAACRSALGGVETGRTFASLTGAFLASGSSAVLASLWDVGDETSASFMSQFYYQLGRGHSPATALRRAKLRLRADPAWDRPELWAAFILIGDAPAVAARRPIPTWAWIVAALVLIAAWLRSRRATARRTND